MKIYVKLFLNVFIINKYLDIFIVYDKQKCCAYASFY